MKMRLPLIIRALWSSSALQELYERRQALRPSEENRTKTTLIVAGSLFFSVMAFLMAMAWMRHDASTYLETRKNIQVYEDSSRTWSVTEPVAKTCFTTESCFNTEAIRTFTPVPDTDTFDYTQLNTGSDLTIMSATVDVSLPSKERFVGQDTWSITLPTLIYESADIFINGNYVRSTYDSEHIEIPLTAQQFAGQTIDLHAIFTLSADQTHFFRSGRDGNNVLQKYLAVMPRSEWNGYKNFLASNKVGRGNYVGAIARIVMAVFVLILFLLVDGSPESLGLGLFLGFEALAISFGYGWLPLENQEFIKHYCFQMGDIFRLYFFLQMARVIDKNASTWLFWGTVVSIPYGILRYYSPEMDWTWVKWIPRNRDIIVGAIGTWVCLRSASYLWGKNLPWRVCALIVAGLGSFEQTIDPLAAGYIPILHEQGWFTTIVDITQPVSVWLVAFSAFINISTMENRIKVLSTVEARAKEIQSEMELGRTVQRAFLHIPDLPSNLKVVCHHEAMLYVSGDTYFVHRDREHNRLTLLINDVTGHGVQAALKASAASVIAKSIAERQGEEDGLAQFDHQMQRFLAQMSDTPDINAMGGAEFYEETGRLVLYRANFPFPLLIEPTVDFNNRNEPHLGELWNPSFLPIKNQESTTMQLKPGSFLVFGSDGFIDTSRREREFLMYLRQRLATKDFGITPDYIKDLFISGEMFKEKASSHPDDRTLLVFQWYPYLASASKPGTDTLTGT